MPARTVFSQWCIDISPNWLDWGEGGNKIVTLVAKEEVVSTKVTPIFNPAKSTRDQKESRPECNTKQNAKPHSLSQLAFMRSNRPHVQEMS